MSDTDLVQTQQEARSATNTVSDTFTATKKQSGSTGKQHQLRIPVCKLKQIQVQCSGDDKGARKLVVSAPPSGDSASYSDPDQNATAILDVVPHGKTHTGTVLKQYESELLGVAIDFSYEYTTGYATTGDKVTLTFSGQSPCGKHPLWTVMERGAFVAAYPGPILVYEFLPPVPDQNQLPRHIKAWWLKDVSPRVYQVTCKTCKGSDDLQPIEIHVYPNVESSTTLKFGKPEPGDKKPAHSGDPLSTLAGKLLKSVTHLIKDFSSGKPSHGLPPCGQVELANLWEEDAESTFARWSGSVSIGLAPVIGFKLRESVIPALAVLQRVLPDWVLKHVNVDVYAELTGEINWSLSFDWYKYPDRAVQVQRDLKEALGGELGFELGVEAWVGKKAKAADDSLIYATVHGNTAIGVEGTEKLTDELELEVEAEVSWSGIGVTGEIVWMYGKKHKEGTWQVCDEAKHIFGPHKLFADEGEDSSDEGSE